MSSARSRPGGVEQRSQHVPRPPAEGGVVGPEVHGARREGAGGARRGRDAETLSLPDLEAEQEDLQDQAAGRTRREGEARQEPLTALEARADLADRLDEPHERLGRERGRNEELRRAAPAARTAAARAGTARAATPDLG